jgi:putative heme-binding domain-containing protein
MMLSRLIFCLLLATSVQGRVPWTSSRLQGSPEPAKPYVSEQIWAGHEIHDALEIAGLPGQVLVVENGGRIWSLPLNGKGAEKTLVIDLKLRHEKLDHAYGLALHPKWRENREVYLTYTLGAGVEDGTKLARFKLSSLEPLVIDPGSEEVLLTWLSGGHNGAHLQFGPDGMLYVSTGDAEVPAPPDPRNTGQDNSDLLSSILRLDVDAREAGKAYAIPQGNPFLGKEGVRPEIWAFGFRNPWKISFDDKGRLWCGDVGWELWEMIHLVGRGTNHGWSAMESTQPVKPERLSPLAPITPPVVAHSHTEAASITGGYVYQGMAHPELKGAYIYGDYETGKIWALWHDGTKVTRHEEIADTPHKIVSFGLLDDGEIIYVHWARDSTFHRLVRNPAAGRATSFPRRLSETGLFADVSKQAPAAGVYEYEIMEPMWQDGLKGRRFIALPGEGGIEAIINRRKDGSVANTQVKWPADAVLVKTLTVAFKGVDSKVETQVLHYDGEAWNGYSYAWNEAGTDAELVGLNGGVKTMQGREIRLHSRAECSRCHTPWAGFALGFQPQQLSRIDGRQAQQAGLELGLVNPAFFETSRARLVSSHDDGAGAEARARSWLHANCAHCHRQHGGGSVALKVNIELSSEEMELIGAKPLRGDMGIPDARLVAPGKPWQSAVLARMARTGAGRMPALGSHEVDQHGFEVLWNWMASLKPESDGKALEEAARMDRQIEEFQNRNDPWSDPEALRSLVGARVPMALRVLHWAHQRPAELLDAEEAVQGVVDRSTPDIAALYERFLPPEKRRKVIGLTPDEAHLLSLSGDVKRGQALLSPTGALATCLACHFVNGTGRDFGPDLSKIGARMTRVQILESLLHPSRQIAPGYASQVLEMKDGTVQVGFLVEQTREGVLLKLATGQSMRVRKSGVKALKPQAQSLMPEGLLQSLTAVEVADLLAFLESLK